MPSMKKSKSSSKLTADKGERGEQRGVLCCCCCRCCCLTRNRNTNSSNPAPPRLLTLYVPVTTPTDALDKAKALRQYVQTALAGRVREASSPQYQRWVCRGEQRAQLLCQAAVLCVALSACCSAVTHLCRSAHCFLPSLSSVLNKHHTTRAQHTHNTPNKQQLCEGAAGAAPQARGGPAGRSSRVQPRRAGAGAARLCQQRQGGQS